MARLEFVAGIVDRLALVEEFLSKSPEVIAQEALLGSLVEVPRPPWRTGELRNSGAVYIGGRLHMTTPEVAAWHGYSELLEPNPRFTGESGILSSNLTTGRALGRHLSGLPLVPNRLRRDTLVGGTTESYGSTGFDTLRNKITIYYHAPHAALMHEWSGGFTDPLSGSHYISSKLGYFSSRFVTLLRQHFDDIEY
jgi:hypothetical protein